MTFKLTAKQHEWALILSTKRVIREPSPELLALAKEIASRPQREMTDAEIDEWAAMLAADVANAND